jgi:lipoprotein-anchoring transpeptidase ErfK/SrfK
MYDGPGAPARPRRVIGFDVAVEVLAGPMDTNWYQIRYQATTGYVRAGDLRQGSAATTLAAVNLRAQPGTEHPVMTTIPAQAAVTITAGPVNTRWYAVEYAGQQGYVHRQYVARQGRGGPKHIVVDLSEQWVYAYDGAEEVYAVPTTTGKDGFRTPTGSFTVQRRYRAKSMQGSGNGESWYAANVPYILFFTERGHALHGAPWVPGRVFGSGQRRSHGCVNLPVMAAAWLFGWAEIGTTVEVRP